MHDQTGCLAPRASGGHMSFHFETSEGGKAGLSTLQEPSLQQKREEVKAAGKQAAIHALHPAEWQINGETQFSNLIGSPSSAEKGSISAVEAEKRQQLELKAIDHHHFADYVREEPPIEPFERFAVPFVVAELDGSARLEH
uniref:Uncharacterized protein n=1 Tax=Ditylenchus dipsaci TaxID=166011 RepID=A0A915EDG5_9BILA